MTSAQAPVTVEGAVAVAYTGEARGPLEFLNADKARIKLISLGGALGGTSLLVAIIVVVGTFALSIQQRLREIALLRAVAATPGQIRKMIGGEALRSASPPAAIGAALGIGLAFWLRTRFVALGAMPVNLELVVSPFPIFVAVAATVVAAWAAARVSARRTARVRPVRRSATPRWARRACPWSAYWPGWAAWRWSHPDHRALHALLRGRVQPGHHADRAGLDGRRGAARPGRRPGRRRGAGRAAPRLRGGGHLAAANLRAGARRLASVITPLTLMVAMTCTILFVQDTMGHAAAGAAAAGNRADHALWAAGPGRRGREAVRKAPGVTAVTEVLHTAVRVGLTKYGVQASTPPGSARPWISAWSGSV